MRLCPALHVGRGHLREQELAEELAHAVLHPEDGLGRVRVRVRVRVRLRLRLRLRVLGAGERAGQVLRW